VTSPDIDELLGDVDDGDRGRLRRAHDALVAAGPPPELPPALEQPPGRPYDAPIPALPVGYPRRRRVPALVLAAALALAAFGAGYLVGDQPAPAAFPQDRSFVMQGTESAEGASASVIVGPRDDAGNWPMRMTVRDLEGLPEGQRYELLLTRKGKPADSCGVFQVTGDRTVVYLNAPYLFREYDGWVVTRAGRDDILLRTEEI
jgi:hypothetical protein